MESLSPERLPGHPHQVIVYARPVANQQGEPRANKPAVAERRVGLVSVWLRERGLLFGSYGVGRGKQHPYKQGPGDHESFLLTTMMCRQEHPKGYYLRDAPSAPHQRAVAAPP